MKEAGDFYVFEKWLEAPSGAFGIKNQPAVVSDEDKEAYWRIHSSLLEAAEEAVAQHPNSTLKLRPKNYSRERGSRGHRPVDLWVSIVGEGADAFGFMPQVYAIASVRGLEIGFAASIPESDYFDPATKSRNRTLVPLINSRLPDPNSAAAKALNEALAADGKWVFNAQTRLVSGDNGYDAYDSLTALLQQLKSGAAVTGGGCICRTFSADELAEVDLTDEFSLALNLFEPLLTMAKPSEWDLNVLKSKEEVESQVEADPFDPSSAEDGRKKVLAEVSRRQGQSTFRKQLLKAYDGKCAISNCDVSDVLQAAHITPYLGPQTNHVSNGILLRADLHTLFDLGFIRIDPIELIVVVSPALSSSPYWNYNKNPIRLPSAKASQPSELALKHRWTMME